MPDQRLRMVAELTDRASGPMRKIREASASIRETPGMKQARAWMTGFNKEADRFVKGGGGIADAMSGMGIGGLAAAASVGTLVARIKELGTHTLALKELGREVGLTTDQVNQFNHAANHFGFDSDKMQGALDHFAGLMPEFRRGFGELNNVLARQPDLIKRLRLEDTKTQLQEIFKFLGTMPNPQDRIKYEEKIFGQNMEPLFAEGTDGFEKQLDRYAKTLTPITKEMEDQAKALRNAITDFNDTVGNLETKYGPQILGMLRQGALEVKHTFDDVIKVVETLQRWKDNPRQAVNDVSNAATDAITRGPQYNYDHWHGTGDFRPPTDAADGQARLDAMQRERDALKSQVDADAKKNPVGFPARHADDFRRLQDLNGAIGTLKDSVAKGAFSKEAPGPSWMEQWRKTHPNDPKPTPAPAPVMPLAPAPAQPSPAPAQPSPPPVNWKVPAAYDREMRARGDGKDHSFDGVVVGSIEKPMLHLAGTLKAAAADAGPGMFRQAAFRSASLDGGASTLDPVATIAAGTREGFLAAYRELSGISSDGATARPGFMPASFGGGGAGGGRAPSIRFGRQHSSAPYDDGGATPTGAHDSLKDLIAAHETGGTGAAGYDTVYGHAEQPGSKMAALAPPKPITQMTISEILAYQRDMKARAHSEAFPVGRAQWVEHTLRGLTRGMDPNTVFTPEVQEKLFDRSIAARMDQGAGGFRSEWDSLRAVPDGEIDRAMEGHRDALRSASAKPADGGSKGSYPDWMDDRSRRELAGVNAPLARDLLAAAQATGMHFRITQGLRTAEEAAHNALTGRGVYNSQHRWGAAADIVMQDAQGRDIRDRAAYKTFAESLTAHSRATGGHSRWLGDLAGRWGSDIVHFDQGIGYGQSHGRDPYGAGGPTADDIAAGNKEIFSGPDNPFLKAAQPLRDAAEQLRGAAAAQRDATKATAGAHQDQDTKPAWYHPQERPDLAEERRKAGLTGPQSVKVDGGVRADIHLHDGQVHKASARTHGSVVASSINLRRGPQRIQSA